MIVESPAKFNLFLNVVDRRKDGYHNVEMINTTLALSDTITVELAGHSTVTCTDSQVPVDDRNLCVRVLDKMRLQYGVSEPVSIHIEKNIPVAGGLGGGSTNAAAVLHALDALFELSMSLSEKIDFIKPITSDGCYSLVGGTCVVKGIGDDVVPISASLNESLRVMLFMPDVKTPLNKTADMYQQLPQERLTISGADALLAFRKNELSSVFYNVFEYCDLPLYQPVYELITHLRETGGVRFAGLCGAGPTVFAVIEDGFDIERYAHVPHIITSIIL